MKTPKSIRLSKQARKDIAVIREQFPYLNDTTAIEYALRKAVAEHAATLTAAAPPAAPKRAKENAK